MKIHLIYPILFVLAVVAGCNRNAAPLVSTLQTEGLHHQWKITELNGYDQPLSQTGLDLRDVYRSFAMAGCDTLTLTPRFGHGNRIELDGLLFYPQTRSCRNNALSSALKQNLAAAYRFELNEGQLELRSRQGRSLLKAVMDPEDENGGIARRWRITKMINVTSDSFALQHPFIDFTDPSASAAFVGCNQLRFATHITAPFSISVSGISGTYRYCKEAAGFESVITRTLPLVAKYQVTGNRLKLFDKEDVLLLEGVADAGKNEPPAGSWNPLRREWMLKKLDGADGTLVIRSRASINLTDLAHTSGVAGCNRARFTTSTGAGEAIGFSSIATTKKFCAEFMKVEDTYLKVLPQIRSYMISGHFIKFKDANGKVLVEGVAADWD